MDLSKKWQEMTKSYGTHPTLIFLKSKGNFEDKSEEKDFEKNGSLEIKKRFIEKLQNSNLNSPHWKTSISHTGGAVLGIGLHSHSTSRGVGVDFELLKRGVSESSFFRFSSIKERKFFSYLQPIEIWVLKEAAFKSNLSSSQTLIPHYSIEEGSKETFYILKCQGFDRFKAQVQLLYFEDYCIALAVSLNT